MIRIAWATEPPDIGQWRGRDRNRETIRRQLGSPDSGFGLGRGIHREGVHPAIEHNGIELHYTPNNEEGHKRLLEKLKKLTHDIGTDFVVMPKHGFLSQRIPLAGVAHQVGTARFGKDAKTSVLDLNCKAHDVDNLYVVDGSFFPSSSAVNPALTIIANALRVGEHIAQRLK